MSENAHFTKAKSRLHNGTTNETACAQAEATLALAYEQRTANLIEWFRYVDHQGDLPDHAAELTGEIFGRLGMDTEQ